MKILGKMKSKPQLLHKTILGLFSVFSAAIGVALLFAIELPRAIVSPDWPTVDGLVVFSRVAESDFSKDVGWYPHISYRYSVNGKEYVAEEIEVIHIGNGNTDYYARQIVGRYPVGERVKVYYSPDNPAVAVLEPGIPDNGVFAPVLFFVGGGIGLSFLCASLLGVLGFAGKVQRN